MQIDSLVVGVPEHLGLGSVTGALVTAPAEARGEGDPASSGSETPICGPVSSVAGGEACREEPPEPVPSNPDPRVYGIGTEPSGPVVVRGMSPEPEVELGGTPIQLVGQLLRDRQAISAAILSGRAPARLRETLLGAALAGGGVYGLAMGVQGGLLQMVVSGIKLPLVIVGAGAVSLPALFMLARLFGGKVNIGVLGELLLQALATATLVMAGLAPLVAVWWLTVTPAGDLSEHDALDAAWQAYRRVVLAGVGVAGVGALVGARQLRGAVPLPASLAWSLVYGLCALQLTWLLRPVVGQPGSFVLGRALEGDGLGRAVEAFFAVLGF
jgi:hypothetical protein